MNNKILLALFLVLISITVFSVAVIPSEMQFMTNPNSTQILTNPSGYTYDVKLSLQRLFSAQGYTNSQVPTPVLTGSQYDQFLKDAAGRMGLSEPTTRRAYASVEKKLFDLYKKPATIPSGAIGVTTVNPEVTSTGSSRYTLEKNPNPPARARAAPVRNTPRPPAPASPAPAPPAPAPSPAGGATATAGGGGGGGGGSATASGGGAAVNITINGAPAGGTTAPPGPVAPAPAPATPPATPPANPPATTTPPANPPATTTTTTTSAPPSRLTKVWQWAKPLLAGAAIFAVLGGVDDYIVSDNLGNTQWHSFGQSGIGAVQGFFSYSLTKAGWGVLSFVGKHTIPTAVSNVKVLRAFGGSGGFFAVLAGFFIGGVAGEQLFMGPAWRDGFNQGMANLKTLPLNQKSKFVTGAEANSEINNLIFFNVNDLKTVDDFERGLVTVSLNNKALKFIKEVKPAVLESATPPVVVFADRDLLVTSYDVRSNIAKFYAAMQMSKYAIDDPAALDAAGIQKYTAKEKLLYRTAAVVDWVTLGASSIKRRTIVGTANIWTDYQSKDPAFRNSVISIYRLDHGGKQVDITDGYYCNSDSKYNGQRIDCQIHSDTGLVDGLYVVERRQLFGQMNYLSMASDGKFDERFFQSNCGLVLLTPNDKARSYFCNEALGGLIDPSTASFSDAGKSDVETYFTWLTSYRDFILSKKSGYANQVFPKEDMDFMTKLIAARGNYTELKKYKYFLATTLYGLPNFSIFVRGDPSNAFILVNGEVGTTGESGEIPVVVNVSSGLSVADYLKALDAGLVEASTAKQPTKEELAADAKAKATAPVAAKSDAVATTKSTTSITWSGLLPSNGSTIIFPKSEKGRQLKLVFKESSWNFIKYVDVYVDGKEVDCYFNTFASIWNGFGGVNTLVYGWGERHEVCDYAVDGKYVVEAIRTSSSSPYSFKITSPILPSACNGKTFEQSSVNVNASC